MVTKHSSVLNIVTKLTYTIVSVSGQLGEPPSLKTVVSYNNPNDKNT